MSWEVRIFFTVRRYVILPPRTYFSPVIWKWMLCFFASSAFQPSSEEEPHTEDWRWLHCQNMGLVDWNDEEQMKPLYTSKSYNRDLLFPDKNFTFIALFRFCMGKQATVSRCHLRHSLQSQDSSPHKQLPGCQVCFRESDWSYHHQCGHLTIALD